MNRLLPAVAAIIVIGVGILAQGFYSERWSARTDEKLKTFTPRVDQVPLVFGNWEGDKQIIDSVQFEGSDATGAISRSYKNRVTGETVSIYLTVGMAYHMAIHEPDQCYPLNGYDIVAKKSQIQIDCGLEEDVEFARGGYHKQGVGVVQILWTFSDDSTWYGPMIPKSAFAGHGALYKLYIITQVQPHENPSVTTRTGKNFANDFMPVLNSILFPPGGEGSDAGDIRSSASDNSETSGQ